MSIGPWDFNGFDTVVLLVLLISLLMAASRGFMRELISIAALVIAGLSALFVYGRFRFAAQDFISPNWLADGALGLGTFFLVYLLMVFLFSGVTKSLRGKKVGILDRAAGAGFGVFRGLLLAALGVMAMTASYHEAKAVQDFKKQMAENGQPIGSDVLENAPPSIREMFEQDEPELPDMFKNSTFYPLLEKIGDTIRALPFAKMRTMADQLKDGDLSFISEEINRTRGVEE